jgi:predicted lipase
MNDEQRMCLIAKDSYTGKFDRKYELIYSGGVDNTQFYILESKDASIITFTGSNQVKDWFTHLFVRRKANTHRGWLRDFGEVSEVLYGYLNEKHKEKLIFTSHSYGCGIQCIAALEIAKQCMFESIKVYSFGSPRIFNKEKAIEMDAYIPNHFRYTNRYDVVTSLPFGFGYRHCGVEIKFPKGKHTIYDYILNIS